MMKLALALLCVFLLHGLGCGCDFEMFSRAVMNFQILTPGGSNCIDSNVGETIILNCESACGDLYWFINGDRVISTKMLDNATATVSGRCINDNNTCTFQTYIDCEKTYEDGRFLLSELTIVPTAESYFLIECEADLCDVEFRKSVMLAVKQTERMSSSIALLSPSSSSTSVTISSAHAVLTPSPSNVDTSNSALSESCENNIVWVLAFICIVETPTLLILLLSLIIIVYKYISHKCNQTHLDPSNEQSCDSETSEEEK